MANENVNRPTGEAPLPENILEGTFLKFLTKDGIAPQAGAYANQWPLPTINDDGSQTPGGWTVRADKTSLCNSGWHATTPAGFFQWLNERAFAALLAVDDPNSFPKDSTKLCANQGQLVYEYTGWTTAEGRLLFMAEMFNLLREGWVRAEADVNVFDAYYSALVAYAADQSDDNEQAVEDASEAIYNVAKAFKVNSKVPVHEIVRVVNLIAGYDGYNFFTANPSYADVATVGKHVVSGLEIVAHQDNVNEHAGKWTTALSASANTEATATIANLFVSLFAPNGIQLPADFTLRRTISRLVSARKQAAAAEKTIMAANLAISNAQASLERAQAVLASAQNDQLTLAGELMELAGGDPIQALLSVSGIR